MSDCCGCGCQEKEKSTLKRNGIFLGAIVLYACALLAEFGILNWSEDTRIVLFFLCYFLIGWEILKAAVIGIFKREYFNENSLMALASVGAFYVGDGAEAVAILLFYRVGEFLEDRIVEKSKKQIRSLASLKEENARILEGEKQVFIAPEKVKKGDVLVVLAGERILADGVVLKGVSSIDDSALSGESIPKNVEVGDCVLSGGINLDGVLQIEATQSYADSALSKILKLIEEGNAQKSRSEEFITKFARFYTPIVTFLAFCVAVIPPLYFWSLGGSFSTELQTWLYRGIIFLVVSCPCALVISIPLSFFAALGRASKEGILVKGSSYLESLNSVCAVVFDKTGTLTKGELVLKEVQTYFQTTEEFAIALAKALESHSNHPIAKAFLKKETKDSPNISLDSVQESAGGGILALFNGQKAVLGNARFVSKQTGQNLLENKSAKCEVFLSLGEKVIASFLLEDALKEEAKEAMMKLKGLELYLLSGDKKEVVEDVAQKVGITQYFSELLPQDKVEHLRGILKKQREKKGKVVFVGDGINDAPSLTLSDVGIAMGSVGSDVALEGADIVIMNDDLRKIPRILKIAQKTRVILWQNIVFALGVKVCIMVLGLFGLTNLWIALFGDVGVALLALLNAIRVIRG